MIKDSVFLYGENDKKTRKDQYDSYKQKDDVITIATFGIASTGISIDRIFCLMLLDSGKSFVRAIQSVGRGTRLAHDKNSVHVVDVYGNLKWSKKHFKERKRFYDEAGYPVTTPVKIKIK
jgi:superfamily II DNA or RNA helicase